MSRIYEKKHNTCSNSVTGIAFGGGGGGGGNNAARKSAQALRDKKYGGVEVSVIDSACVQVNTGVPGGSQTSCLNSDGSRSVQTCLDTNSPGFSAQICKTMIYK